MQNNLITITQENQGQRLDKFLNEQLTEFSRSQIQKMIKNGDILVNGQKVSVHKFLKIGDMIKILPSQLSSPSPLLSSPPKRGSSANESVSQVKPGMTSLTMIGEKIFKDIKIISETEDFLIIEKPAGLLVHPTEKNETATLVDWLIAKYPIIRKIGDDPLRPGLVHRLDKDVSGLMIIPKTQATFEFFKRQFQLRTIDKRYTALVYGEISQDSDKINFFIGRSKAKTGLFAARPQKSKDDDKPAMTEFEVKDRFKNYTLLEIKILTGRTHQIRVHLKAYGHPLVGDNLYFNKKLKTKKELSRIFLHASYLSFTGSDGKYYEFSSPLPKKLATFLKSLKKQ
ncbi:MAG: hypothetical protein A3B89_00230 [Candidatus Buchananbacteria bacterium RIFCSPHIGHO2_02_FULL_40_13]|uniref:Pseudouridine synthase n=1 Tax=Candidatus Buchananbacteria bacterium RIFCSPLOWO2_01_FULL_39_33 TaxID=1797543 RepID=A0A1G1YHC8_9BACT|nr:MAG: hypothetical protein A2820_03110 [Candidatus Buchananbacteria bacterium RIFCSPHIGHO2_01_FULL_40_35]OGY49504.1 MAG: hypothetical protein A3B89_00230 [Candidatus Buchananbacteria bacterium RIFCSPHIGHO2_02_FULL_40_13]OGY51719.1 MAG: hypothetical protein A3A02_02410 [Candidatus Buchananbacteria bacterium RIFCSPLOWO2_01_FULL_39_33]